MSNHNWSLAIHGGAGTILPAELTPQKELAYHTALQDAIAAGSALLQAGATAADAVVAAIVSLENNILFNAGKGSVFAHNGTHQMDAAIMAGADKSAGAVAGITGVVNPILVANSLRLQGKHVLIAGADAALFAKAEGIPFADKDYFYSEQRYQQWLAALATDSLALDHSAPKLSSTDTLSNQTIATEAAKEKKFSTVGAVALDSFGHLAAATSTGGLTNKHWGRVGDTPIVGAGTWADSRCAISCTGWGEVFIKHVVSHRIAAMVEFLGISVADAAHCVIVQELGLSDPDSGGLIAIAADGTISMPFNTVGMYRASAKGNSTAVSESIVAIF